MDCPVIGWYFSGMADTLPIPIFNLFGETTVFPDVVHCERVLDRAARHDWVISPHRHSQMSQIFHIERGAARVLLDGTNSTLEKDEYLYVPPQIVHGFEFIRGTEGFVLSLPSSVIARIGPNAAALTNWLTAPQRGEVTAEIKKLMAEISQAFSGAGIFRAQKLVALAHSLIASLAEDGFAEVTPTQSAKPQIHGLNLLIAEHLADGWRACDYATALHITTGHLNRIVRTATGRSLTSHLETAVMIEACRLIVFTQLPLSEVSYRLGYSDPSYFSRRFRIRMGESPSDYRMRVTGPGTKGPARLDDTA